MVNVLKFSNEKIFFFSDFHKNHDRDFLYPKRGFKNIQEHDTALINNWNSKVDNNSIVFLLGDSVVGAGKNSEESFVQLLINLNYKEIYIMPGNHFAGYRSLFNNSPYLIDKFYRIKADIKGNNGRFINLIPNYYEIIVNGVLCCLSHYPIYSWNMASKNSYLIHGHTHNNIKNHLKGKIIDVGPESIGNSPISFGEIKEIMDKKETFSPDHHSFL